jgi:hypothetical protein
MKLTDATNKEFKEWRETDFMSSMKFSPLIMFVVIPTIVQASCLLMMGASMYLASVLF